MYLFFLLPPLIVLCKRVNHDGDGNLHCTCTVVTVKILLRSIMCTVGKIYCLLSFMASRMYHKYPMSHSLPF